MSAAKKGQATPKKTKSQTMSAKATKKRGGKQVKGDDVEDDGGVDEMVEVKGPKAKAPRRRKNAVVVEDEEDEVVEVKKPKAAQARRKSAAPSKKVANKAKAKPLPLPESGTRIISLRSSTGVVNDRSASWFLECCRRRSCRD